MEVNFSCLHSYFVGIKDVLWCLRTDELLAVGSWFKKKQKQKKTGFRNLFHQVKQSFEIRLPAIHL